MNIEMVFRIYRRLMKFTSDFNEVVVISRDKRACPMKNPSAITVKFIPKRRRKKLTSQERAYINPFCKYHRLKFKMNKAGEMIWTQKKRKE